MQAQPTNNQTFAERIATPPAQPRSSSALYLGTWTFLGTAAAAYIYMLLAQPEWAAPLTTQALRSEEVNRETQVVEQLTEEISVLRTTIANLERELSEVKEAAAKRPVAIINRPQTTADAIEPQDPEEDELTESAAVSVPSPSVAPPEVGSEPSHIASAQPVTPTVLNAPRIEQSQRLDEAESEDEAPAEAVAPPPPVRKVTARTATAEPVAPPPTRTASLPSPQDGPLALKMETGSLPPRELEITFGPPTVTVASEAYAIHLDAGPSLEALRLRWSLLAERHANTLGDLEPRYVVSGPPTAPNYQLIAGPITSAEEASRVCALLRASRVQCTVGGPFVGEAL